jgi:hypothetical protein
MSKQPLYSDAEFVGATQLNNSATVVYAGQQEDLVATHSPGLINPGTVAVTASGMVFTFTCGSNFAGVFGNGFLGRAFGTTAGSTTNVYTVDLTSYVPGSGSQVVYISIAGTGVDQSPYTVMGPPAGHPDFDATFVPYTAYASVYNTLAFGATTTAPDNSTTLEFGRITLSAGQSSVLVSQLVLSHQVFAGSVLNHTGIAAATYAYPDSITVGADGRVSAISDAASPPVYNTSTGGDSIQMAWESSGGVVAVVVDTTSLGNLVTTTTTLGGSLLGSMPNPTLSHTGIAATTYTYPETITVNAEGRVTAISDWAYAPVISGQNTGTHNQVFLGWTSGGQVDIQVDSTPLGYVITSQFGMGGVLQGNITAPTLVNYGPGSGTYKYPSSITVGADGRVAGIQDYGWPAVLNSTPNNSDTIYLAWNPDGTGKIYVQVDSTFEGHMVTDASVCWPSSLSGNGYQKLPNGLILQWFTVPVNTGTVEYTTNYPIAFPSVSLFACCSFQANVPPATGAAGVQLYSNSQCVVINTAPAGGSDGFNVFAIGY